MGLRKELTSILTLLLCITDSFHGANCTQTTLNALDSDLVDTRQPFQQDCLATIAAVVHNFSTVTH